MAPYSHTSGDKPAVARIFSGGVDDALGQEGEALSCLEGGARGIGAHDGSVEQRLQRVTCQGKVVLTSLSADHHAWVVRGR